MACQKRVPTNIDLSSALWTLLWLSGEVEGGAARDEISHVRQHLIGELGKRGEEYP